MNRRYTDIPKPMKYEQSPIQDYHVVERVWETKLPDAAIIRLLEEMILFEVNNPGKYICQNYREYLKSFLHT
jgi:hypothetical protein